MGAAGEAIEEQVSYDGEGLVPCVVQDWGRGEVLTLAYMNARGAAADARERRAAPVEPLARGALAQGRNERQRPGRHGRCAWTVTATRCWHSSSPPGRPATPESGPAFTAVSSRPGAPHETLPALERTLAQRAAERPEGSYTVELLSNPELIGAKVMEEAEEVTRAAREETDERVDEEAADLIYHLLVLLRSRDRSLSDAERVLDGRRS